MPGESYESVTVCSADGVMTLLDDFVETGYIFGSLLRDRIRL